MKCFDGLEVPVDNTRFQHKYDVFNLNSSFLGHLAGDSLFVFTRGKVAYIRPLKPA